jgi:hypothetical protein
MDGPDIHGEVEVIGRQFVIQQKDKEIDRNINAKARDDPKIGLVDADLQVFFHLVKIILEAVKQQYAGFYGQQPAAEVVIVEEMLRQAEVQHDEQAEQPGHEPLDPDQKRLVQPDKKEREKIEPHQRVYVIQVVVGIPGR